MSKRPHSDDLEDQSTAKRRDTRSTESFAVRPAQHYAGQCAIYKQPIEINSYSIDGERRVWFDDRELKQYHPIRIDGSTPSLCTGFERFIKRDDTLPEHLDTLLDAITDAKKKRRSLGELDIVTWRGIMTKILCTPYTRNEPWELRATRSNGTIYMEEVTLPSKKEREANATQREQMMSYWGYRFEVLCTNDPDGSANTNVQYCVIVKTRLGKNNILMGAEVDCIDGPKSKDPLKQYIELKTSRHIETGRHQYSFERYKLLKFWAQSFLVGVPRVVCGFRDDNGYLTSMETLKTLEIPRRVRDKPNMWDASVCLNFADQFLDWLRKVITVDDPNTTYSIAWKEPFKEITVRCNGRVDAFLTQRYFDGDVSHDIGGPRVSSNTN